MAIRKPKQRVHREWFRTVMDKRKSCPSCYIKLAPGEQIWSWGEYLRAKWRTVDHFCRQCFPTIQKDLTTHAGGCGCQFELVGYQGTQLPEWLSLGDVVCKMEVNNNESETN